MISISNIHFQIDQSPLLKDISWQFSARKTSVIVGANGAGKSSLLKVLLGVYRPQQGGVNLLDHSLNSWSTEQLAAVRAYMAQASRANLSLPVFEYLALARLHRGETQADCDQYVGRVIGELELTPLAKKPIDQLSGGEFQRIELARAWCQLLGENGLNNTLLLLDEPASALDIRQTQKLYQHLAQYVAAGGTAIVVEHDINLAARFADHMLMLRKGECIAAGTVQQVFNQDNINQCFDVNGKMLIDNTSQARSFSL